MSKSCSSHTGSGPGCAGRLICCLMAQRVDVRSPMPAQPGPSYYPAYLLLARMETWRTVPLTGDARVTSQLRPNFGPNLPGHKGCAMQEVKVKMTGMLVRIDTHIPTVHLRHVPANRICIAYSITSPTIRSLFALRPFHGYQSTPLRHPCPKFQ